MPRFFVPPEKVRGGRIEIDGADARHIAKSLRMAAGDELIVCDGANREYFCRIGEIGKQTVFCNVEREAASAAEPELGVSLFMALAKGDKFDAVVKKSVELGVYEIYPVLSERCVARPEKKNFDKKLQRYRELSLSAAKQAGRAIVPEVHPLTGFDEAIELMAARFDRFAMLYELAGRGGVRELLAGGAKKVAFLVGAEGGFSVQEAEKARAAGAVMVGLGPRILRCETAPICFLSILMHEAGELD